MGRLCRHAGAACEDVCSIVVVYSYVLLIFNLIFLASIQHVSGRSPVAQ
jgi:hypothetical protein